MCLIDVLRHDFEEERVGAVDVEQSVKVRDELVFYTGDFIGFSCDEEFVVVCLDMFGKWFDMADREPVDPGFQFGVLVRVEPGQYGLLGISYNIDIKVSDDLKQRCSDVFWKESVVDDLPAPAVGDASAVEGENVASKAFQLQFFCKGKDAGCWASACKYYFDSVFLYPDQCLFCLGRDLLFGIGQCAVKIQGEDLVIHHNVSPFSMLLSAGEFPLQPNSFNVSTI